MDKAELSKFYHDLSVFAQSLAYYFFATVAGLAIMTGMLAEPVVRHYADSNALNIQQFKIDQLRDKRDQQNELLRRLDNAEIVKRAAKVNLNFVSSPDEKVGHEDFNALLSNWPEMAQALEQVAPKEPQTVQYPFWYNYFQFLADNKGERMALLAFGACLIVISLTCFGSKKYC